MEHLYSNYWEYNGYKVIECESCGYSHLYPIPTWEILDDYYKNLYHGQVKPFRNANVDEEYIETAKKTIVSNIGFNNIFNIANRYNGADCKNMLDFGCGSNLISVFFKQKGWDSYIIEPSIDSFKYMQRYDVKGFNCFFEEIDKLNLPPMAFINIQYVLEHMVNPYDTLLKARGLLDDGGVIRVVVPNDFSDGHRSYIEHFKKEPKWVSGPDHINYFNFETIERLVTKLGLEVVYKSTSFPLEMLLLSGLDYYNDVEARAKVNGIVTNFQKSLIETDKVETLYKFYNKLAEAGFGRSVEIYIKKI